VSDRFVQIKDMYVAALACSASILRSSILVHFIIHLHKNIGYVCVYIFHWSHNWQSDFVYITSYCFMFLNQLSGSCGTPSSLSNGQRRYSSTTVRSRVTYTCNSGYLRTAGSSTRTCQPNGQWSGSHPTCTRKSTLCHFIYILYIPTTNMRKNCLYF